MCPLFSGYWHVVVYLFCITLLSLDVKQTHSVPHLLSTSNKDRNSISIKTIGFQRIKGTSSSEDYSPLPKYKSQRTSRFINPANPFGILGTPNCQHQGYEGTCFEAFQCMFLGGTLGPLCRGLRGTCCRFFRSCGERSSQEVSYFSNNKFDSSIFRFLPTSWRRLMADDPPDCDFRVVKRTENYCGVSIEPMIDPELIETSGASDGTVSDESCADAVISLVGDINDINYENPCQLRDIYCIEPMIDPELIETSGASDGTVSDESCADAVISLVGLGDRLDLSLCNQRDAFQRKKYDINITKVEDFKLKVSSFGSVGRTGTPVDVKIRQIKCIEFTGEDLAGTVLPGTSPVGGASGGGITSGGTSGGDTSGVGVTGGGTTEEVTSVGETGEIPIEVGTIDGGGITEGGEGTSEGTGVDLGEVSPPAPPVPEEIPTSPAPPPPPDTFSEEPPASSSPSTPEPGVEELPPEPAVVSPPEPEVVGPPEPEVVSPPEPDVVSPPEPDYSVCGIKGPSGGGIDPLVHQELSQKMVAGPEGPPIRISARSPLTSGPDVGSLGGEDSPVTWDVPSNDETIFSYFMGAPSFISSRISNGIETIPKEFPWQVALFKSGNKFHCGASIIGDFFILTAAHCVINFVTTPQSLTVRLGEWSLAGTSEGPIIAAEVEKITVHPQYSRMNLQNDLGVIKLKKRIEFSERIRPVCLLTTNFNLTGEMATITGWGKNELGSSVDKLNKLTSVIMDNDDCNTEWGGGGVIVASMMCMDPTSGDSCNGDSGGPSVIEVPADSGKYYQVGIVSFGSGSCTDKNLPGVYTRVNFYRDWIFRQMV